MNTQTFFASIRSGAMIAGVNRRIRIPVDRLWSRGLFRPKRFVYLFYFIYPLFIVFLALTYRWGKNRLRFEY